MTGLPRIFSSASDTGRAARSAWPPAGNGTIMVILREGYVACANAEFDSAACASGNTPAALRSSRRFIGSFLPSDFVLVIGGSVARNRREGKGALFAPCPPFTRRTNLERLSCSPPNPPQAILARHSDGS